MTQDPRGLFLGLDKRLPVTEVVSGCKNERVILVVVLSMDGLRRRQDANPACGDVAYVEPKAGLQKPG